jgi:hypothetical protein
MDPDRPPGNKSKGAPGLAFETWDPRNRSRMESPPPCVIRPERTRIPCHGASPTSTCAAFVKESRMKFADAANTNRKSGDPDSLPRSVTNVHVCGFR